MKKLLKNVLIFGLKCVIIKDIYFYCGDDSMKLVNIGFGNAVNADRIVAVVSPEAAPVKRIVQTAKDDGTAIDATCGRKTRSVIVCDSGHVVMSALQPETLTGKLEDV